MRQITIDFGSQTYPLFAGYVGEHNATEITAIKPTEISGEMYSFAFMTNGEVIHSRYFSADEELRIKLWEQLTLDSELFVQLEAYNGDGDYLGKSTMVKLILSNSAHGMDVVADADNPDVYSEIAQNSVFREMLEDNADTLDKLTTSEDGKLLFDGELIEGAGGGGGLTEEQAADLEANTEARHKHGNKSVFIPADEVSYTHNNIQDTSKTVKGALDEAIDYVTSEVPDLIDKKHTHTNKDVLDSLDEENGVLTYKGNTIGGSGTTKRPTAEITLEMWNEQYVDATKQTILLGADEIDIDPALVGKEIADVEFLTGNEIVSIKDIAEKDSIGYISMYNHFVAGEVDGVPITFFAGVFYPSNKGWLYVKLTSYAINAIKITYYTD